MAGQEYGKNLVGLAGSGMGGQWEHSMWLPVTRGHHGALLWDLSGSTALSVTWGSDGEHFHQGCKWPRPQIWENSKWDEGQHHHPKGFRQDGGRVQQESQEIKQALHLKRKNPRHWHMLRTDKLAQVTGVFSYKKIIFEDIEGCISVLISLFILCLVMSS